MKICMPLSLMLCLFGCDQEATTPVGEKRTPDSTVYLAGGSAYWKNGVRTGLDVHVYSMSVVDSSVVIGGFKIDPPQSRAVILYNGQEISLTSGGSGIVSVVHRDNDLFAVYGRQIYRNGMITPIENIGWPTGMALLGDDVYIAGTTQGAEHPWMVSPFYSLDTYAICWRNDKVVFRESVYSYANTIFVHGDDVYLGGHRNHFPSLDKVACYWKNGERVELTDVSQDAQVWSLFVTDAHVYAAGEKDDEAVFWIDGNLINLSTSASPSVARSLSVLGTDVYVAGAEDKRAAVWKNGVKQVIPDLDSYQGEIRVVVAVANGN